MTFKVTANPVFTHEVRVPVPVNGGFRDETLKVTYRVLSTDAMMDLNLDDPASAKEFLQRVVVGLDDIVGVDGQPLPYNDALRDQVIGFPYARIAIARAYIEALTKARLGN